jgi:hypothetical protein
MANFTAGDRDWKVRLTVGLLGQIKRDTGIDLGAVMTQADRFQDLLFAEPGKLVEILWLVCEAQAAADQITPEAFAGFFGGDELDAAIQALIDGAIDFFPRARGREAVKRALPRALAKMAVEAGRILDQKLATFLPSAGNSPDCAESIPAS